MNNIIISNNIIRKASNFSSAINATNIANNIGKISICNNDISCTEEKLDQEMWYNPAIYIEHCKGIDLNINGNNIHDYNSGGVCIKTDDTIESNINVVICDNIFNNLGLLSNTSRETNNIIISLYYINGKTIIVDENKCINCLGHITFLKFYKDYFDNMSLANNLTFGLTFISSSFISGKSLANYIRCYGNTSEWDLNHISFNNGSVSYSDTIGTRFNHFGGAYPASIKTISYTNDIPSKTNEHGDIIFYDQPQRDKCIGKVCVNRGNTGTWLPFGKIEPSEVFHGITTNRPILTNSDTGFVYFDTTLGKPIYWNGAAWVDATGADV